MNHCENLERLLNDDNVIIQDLHSLFEQSKLEMITLLNYSLNRFKKTEDYMNVLNLFGIEATH